MIPPSNSGIPSGNPPLPSGYTAGTQAATVWTNLVNMKRGGMFGGGASAPASGPVLGDTTLWAARSMALSRLTTAQANKDAAAQTTSSLQSLAQIAYTDTYDAYITQLENNVSYKNKIVQTLHSYKVSSLNSVARFSSLYDQAAIDVKAADDMVKLYSTYYISSMIGASTLQGLYDADEATINADNAQADAISYGISSLVDDYNNN